MWKRDCELDTEALPIPSRIASNEEFIPPQQKEYEAKLHVLADDAAKIPTQVPAAHPPA
jgi:hypothetical protein